MAKWKVGSPIKYCTSCFKENAVGASYCIHCGNTNFTNVPLYKSCPKCGARMYREATVCPDCKADISNTVSISKPGTVKYCNYCGLENKLDADVCAYCKKPLDTGYAETSPYPEFKICPNCGARLRRRDEKCPFCSENVPPPKPGLIAPNVCPECGSKVGEYDLICNTCGTDLVKGEKWSRGVKNPRGRDIAARPFRIFAKDSLARRNTLGSDYASEMSLRGYKGWGKVGHAFKDALWTSPKYAGLGIAKWSIVGGSKLGFRARGALKGVGKRARRKIYELTLMAVAASFLFMFNFWMLGISVIFFMFYIILPTEHEVIMKAEEKFFGTRCSVCLEPKPKASFEEAKKLGYPGMCLECANKAIEGRLAAIALRKAQQQNP